MYIEGVADKVISGLTLGCSCSLQIS